MAVYDFATAQETDIKDGYIGYPSQGIPRHQLAFSPDGASIYWVNAGSSVWQAPLDAPQATKLGELRSLFAAISPRGLVAFSEEIPLGGKLGTLVIEDVAANTRVEIGRAPLSFAWRPGAP
ncbi:MAG TPA: hypothetical protein VLS25_13455 [Dehalococcoidia bacterium]|nr:hypothetical protein [Dehalococcoidia bacterium]